MRKKISEDELRALIIERTNELTLTDYDEAEELADYIVEYIRECGYMHHSDPVEGCGEVKEKCPELEKCERAIIQPGECAKYPICNGKGFISRPLTLGELPEQVRKMREALKKTYLYLDKPHRSGMGNVEIIALVYDAFTFKGKKEGVK
jgi:hypothetical protein